MLENATRVCGAKFGTMVLYEGDHVRRAALYNVPPAFAAVQKTDVWRPHPESGLNAIAKTKQVIHVDDLRTHGPYLQGDPMVRALSDLAGARTIVMVPMLKENELIGAISIYRQEVKPFTDKQIALVSNFANQAVIAIENTRLLRELRQRTDDLSESLEQQTATAEILSSISGSLTDTKPVFDAIVRNLRRLFGTRFAVLQTLRDDGMVEMPAVDGDPGFEKLIDRYPRPLSDDTVGGLAMLSKHPVQYSPVLGNPATPATTQEFARDFGFDSVIFTPMLLAGRVIGAIGVARREPMPFDEKQIALIGSFASQAVIAIENTRLLKELRQRTDDLSESLEQQTATSEVLETISSSPGELEPVFQKMLENATRVCGANFGTMNLYDGEAFQAVANYNIPPAYTALRHGAPIRPHAESGLAAVIRTHQAVHIHDLRKGRAYLAGDPSVVGISDIAGARTIVIVPMLKEDELIGNIAIYRQEVRPFTDKQVGLVENFTKQAVIAIENTRLLRELRARTTELSQSLEDLRTAQDRLVQTEKLASLGQLTAGIAHEIKNPLNFVNNFSTVSVELIDEMNDVLKDTKLDAKTREEIDELTHMLKGNLEKVVQHGKRANSIVKNMLLHSREGSGEHRPADINAIIEESLNLAYHGARAEKSGFNIALKRDLDPKAGMVDLYPQEITRVFLNLISNGFYAATKRKEAGVDGFEPTLSAATKNLGNAVEIRIRDNGAGIPSEVKEKIFNPFFTTKPAGEGTGLGLSMSHDIVVKQHGGKIDVVTEPGSFTEFIITLPRTMAARPNAGGTN